jgi:NADH-quinone oxidoreductase subunit A
MTQTTNLWPLIIYFAAVLAVVAVMLGLPAILGQRSRGKATMEPFESGIVPVGDTRLRFSVQFYLIAIFFVIFDLEAVYIFAWAVAFRESGWAGYVEIAVFIGVLGAALVYLWLIGALDWRTRRQRLVESKVKT